MSICVYSINYVGKYYLKVDFFIYHRIERKIICPSTGAFFLPVAELQSRCAIIDIAIIDNIVFCVEKSIFISTNVIAGTFFHIIVLTVSTKFVEF